MPRFAQDLARVRSTAYRFKRYLEREGPQMYVQRYGGLQGLGVYLRLLRGAQGPLRVPLPFGGSSVTIRGGTSDVRLFREFLLRDLFPLPAGVGSGLVVDAGANIGLVSLYLATSYPAAKVLAIEPEASNLELLRMNTSGISNIEVIEGALWPRSTNLSIANPEAEKWSFKLEEGGATSSGVRGFTVPELMARAGVSEIDLLKIDVEGGEKDLFQGDVSWLAHVRVLVIELHDRFRPGCSDAVNAAMRRYGFTETVHGENHIFVARAA